MIGIPHTAQSLLSISDPAFTSSEASCDGVMRLVPFWLLVTFLLKTGPYTTGMCKGGSKPDKTQNQNNILGAKK